MGNSASKPSTSPKPMLELHANINTEQINPVSSDNIQKDTTKKQDGVTVNNSNENEQENSQLSSCRYFIKEYKTLQEAESATKLEITYSNNEQYAITFRAGKDIDNLSGDYNIYMKLRIYIK